MHSLKQQFIEFAIEHRALQFGQFTLKSGRISPYFFNAGLFNDGSSLAQLGRFYAQTLLQTNLEFDALFGPAYKGIPLATATAMALNDTGINKPVTFNRKENKGHGEGGTLIGAPLRGRVVMVDDVITAGTAFRESKQLIEAQGAKLAGVIIALDRQECGSSTLSAIQEIEKNHQIPVYSIIALKDLIAYLTFNKQQIAPLDAIKAYRQKYGC